MNRREFMQGASAVAMAQALGRRAFAANDKVQVGVIGPGSRGQELIRQLLRVPGVELSAVCDIYEPRFAQVNTLVGKKVPAYRDYRELLSKKEIDAVIVATPIALHAEHMVAALESGKPVYGEKAMGFTVDDCNKILDAAEKSGQVLQVGHEYRYADWILKTVDEVHAGKIGEPTHVYAYWHRNNDWRRPVPSPDLEHLINWRLYKESSGGLLAELGSHHIDIANWVFGEFPQKVSGSSSIVRYHDGRTVGDNIQAIFQYTKGRRLLFSSLTDNAKCGNVLWIYGTEGSVEITIEDATFYYEERKAHRPAIASGQVVQHGIKTGASYKPKGEMPYEGPGEKVASKDYEDPTLTACRAFIDCVRTKKQPFADVRVGYGSAIATAIGNQALLDETVHAIPERKLA